MQRQSRFNKASVEIQTQMQKFAKLRISSCGGQNLTISQMNESFQNIKATYCSNNKWLSICKLKSGETAIFAYIVFKSKAHRNQVNKKVMKEMGTMDVPKTMPFDMKRFAMAGCKTIVYSKKR